MSLGQSSTLLSHWTSYVPQGFTFLVNPAFDRHSEIVVASRDCQAVLRVAGSHAWILLLATYCYHHYHHYCWHAGIGIIVITILLSSATRPCSSACGQRRPRPRQRLKHRLSNNNNTKNKSNSSDNNNPHPDNNAPFEATPFLSPRGASPGGHPACIDLSGLELLMTVSTPPPPSPPTAWTVGYSFAVRAATKVSNLRQCLADGQPSWHVDTRNSTVQKLVCVQDCSSVRISLPKYEHQ